MTGLTPRVISNHLNFALFVFPILILFVAFFVIPFATGLFYSLITWNGISSEWQLVGMSNYFSLVSEPNYLSTILFTLEFVALNVVSTVIFGFILAFTLEKSTRANVVLRVLFFLPNIISPLVAGFIWTFLFKSVIPNLGDLSGLDFLKMNFLGDPQSSLFSLVAVSFWQSVGYVMIIFIAGLNIMDKSVMESALIDGAGAWTRMRRITIPLIMPAITVNLFWLLSQSFRLFDLNVALTGGGPGKTTTSMALDIYQEGYGNNHMGLASAKAFILFLIVLVVTILQLRFTKSKEVQL